jgi:hypothetical protein
MDNLVKNAERSRVGSRVSLVFVVVVVGPPNPSSGKKVPNGGARHYSTHVPRDNGRPDK